MTTSDIYVGKGHHFCSCQDGPVRQLFWAFVHSTMNTNYLSSTALDQKTMRVEGKKKGKSHRSGLRLKYEVWASRELWGNFWRFWQGWLWVMNLIPFNGKMVEINNHWIPLWSLRWLGWGSLSLPHVDSRPQGSWIILLGSRYTHTQTGMIYVCTHIYINMNVYILSYLIFN